MINPKVMENIYFIELSEQKTFPKITYYQYEINGILHDTEHLFEASFFNSIDFAEDLKVYIEGCFDYNTRIVEYKLV